MSIAESDDSSVQDEFRRRLIQLDAQHKAEKIAASLRAALEKNRGTRKRTAFALADFPSSSSVSGSVTPSSGNKEVEIVGIEQANPKDGSKPCKRTATCKAADFSESCELKKTIDANLSVDPVGSKTDLDIVSDDQQQEPVPEHRAEILDAIDSDIAKHVEEQNLHDKTITAFRNKSFQEPHGKQKTASADERTVDGTNITKNFTREGLCTTAASSA